MSAFQRMVEIRGFANGKDTSGVPDARIIVRSQQDWPDALEELHKKKLVLKFFKTSTHSGWLGKDRELKTWLEAYAYLSE